MQNEKITLTENDFKILFECVDRLLSVKTSEEPFEKIEHMMAQVPFYRKDMYLDWLKRKKVELKTEVEEIRILQYKLLTIKRILKENAATDIFNHLK